jgi:ribonucleotide monophosphatase NagD (HAD superfamily)
VNNLWIIGGGKFGLRAAESLSKKHSLNNLTIVEKDKAVCRQLNRLGFEAVCTDGIQYLERNLTDAHDPDWIVPAIPLHVAYEWIWKKLSKTRSVQKIAVPNDLVAALPNPIKAGTGQLLISIANFTCPENCPEPEEICTYTGKPRPMVLHEFLKSLQRKDIKPVVIRSHQLAPGVGGYTPRALFAALNEIETAQMPVALSTACSCHGVMDTFQLSAK